MVQQEEIRGKLSLDTTVLGKAKRDIAEFAEHGHSGFVHAGNAARGFHRTLEKITEASPLLGTALTAALSPVNAAFLAAGLALTYFNKKLEEWNAEMDKAQSRNATAIFGADAIRAAAAEQHKMASEHQHFMSTREDASKAFMASLDEEQQRLKDNLEIEQARLKIRKDLSAEIIKQRVASGAMSQTAGMALLSGLEGTSSRADFEQKMHTLSARLALLQRGAGTALEEFGGAKQTANTLEGEREAVSGKLARREALVTKLESDLEANKETARNVRTKEAFAVTTLKNGYDIDKSRAAQEAIIREADAAQEKTTLQLKQQKDAVEHLREEQDNLNSAYGEAKDKVTQWRGALTTIAEEQAKIKNEANKTANSPVSPAAPTMPSSPIEFGLGELAQYQTYYGAVARAIQYRQRLAKAYAASPGGMDISRSILSTVDPAGGPNSLYSLLPPGMTADQNSAARQQQFIKELTSALGKTSDGILVHVTSVPNGP